MANNRWNDRTRRWEYSDEDEGQDMNRNYDYNRNRFGQRGRNFDYNAGDFNRDQFGYYDRNSDYDQGGNFNQGYYDQGGYGYNRNMGYGGYNRSGMNEYDRGNYNRGYYDEGYGGWNDMGTSRGPNWQNRFNQGRFGNQGWNQSDYGYNQGRNRFGMQNQRGYGYNQGLNQGAYGYNRGINRSGYQGRMDTDYDLETDYLETEIPETWTYTEYWLIPGPFTGIGPENYQRSDERISDDICDRLTQHGKLDASDIHVDVKDGEVTLTGNVKDRNQKRMSEDVAESVFGVCDVHNQLKVQKSGGKQGQSQSQGKQHKQGQTK